MTKERKQRKRQKRVRAIKDFRQFGIKKYGEDFFKIYSRYQSIKQRMKRDFSVFVDTFIGIDGFCDLYKEKITLTNGTKCSVSSWIHTSQKLMYVLLQSVVFDNLSDEEFLKFISDVSNTNSIGREIDAQALIDTRMLRATFGDFLYEIIDLYSVTKRY